MSFARNGCDGDRAEEGWVAKTTAKTKNEKRAQSLGEFAGESVFLYNRHRASIF